MSRIVTRFLFILLLLIMIGVGYSAFHKDMTPAVKKKPIEKSGEIEQIKKSKDIRVQSEWYLRLIERIGPVEAQEALQYSGLPYSGQGHLLNHVVGDYLYKKEGPKGIVKCKDYFSSSCHHGVVINAIGDGKLDNLTVMLDACRKEVRSTYAGCVHALGHGFLAYKGYANIPDALALCDEMNDRVTDFLPYYCYNGVFMENIWGLHTGEPSPDRWINPDDFYYPCNDPRIEQKHQTACWYNQPFQISRYLDGDLVKVASVCEELVDEASKQMCFDGIFRSLHAKTQNDLKTKLSTCEKMPEDWINICIVTQASASFQQGDRKLPYQICGQVEDLNKERCYLEIAQMISYYTKPAEHPALCQKIPIVFRQQICIKYS